MSHYSDIGFKLTKNEDVIELFNRINKDESIKRGSWDLNGSDDTIYVMYYFGEIRYSVELDNVNNYINRIGLGHNNERISKAIYNGKIKVGEETGEFDTLVIKKDGIPFWFSCPNMGIFHIKEDEHEDLDLKIDEMYEPQFSKDGMDGFYWAQGLFKALVQEEINALKEAADDQSGAG